MSEEKGEIVEAEKKEASVDVSEKIEDKAQADALENNEDKVKTDALEKHEDEAQTDIDLPKEHENEARPQISRNHGSGMAVAFSTLALILGIAGLVLGWMGFQKASTPITFLGGGADGNSANFVEGSIADIADKVSKSVVSIITSTTTKNYFGQDYSAKAAGTGVIATADGYIITNKHVINGASKVTVILDDGTSYENVEVVAVDPLDDIAYLKIKDVSDLTPATLGDSKTIHVGQQVIAIGNALGEYQNTVTAGIISGTGRSVTASDGSGQNVETLTDMIQTDAAINSGNSGGPLVNAAGEVIGINTATSATAENMGFAIPISSVKGMLNQLVETGSAERA